MQVAGDNFIVPVDTKLTTPYDIEQQTIKVADIFNYVASHAHAQLIFLDACRNNPFKIDRFWIGDTLKVADASTGLARANYGVGSLIAFSTEPGAVAYDGIGALSPYTSALVHHITAPNEEIRHALTQVRREVIAATEGRQVPWENSSLVDDVYLMPAPPGPSVQSMVHISIPPTEGSTPVHIPAPRRVTDEGLFIRIEQAPDQGKLMLGGKPLDLTRSLTVADLDHLAFDTTGLGRGAIGLLTYVVTDKWAQSARGMVAITLDAAPTPRNQGPNPAVAAGEALRKLDHREAQAIIGIGPASLGLEAHPDGAAEAPSVVVETAPTLGVLKLGDRTVTAGQQIAFADLPSLAYLPPVGAEGRRDDFQLKLADGSASAALGVTPALDDCDREAAGPLDLQGVAKGKLPNEIDAPKAIAACERAVAAYPGTPRFRYQLGRALLAAGRNADAKIAIAAAAQAKHTRALWELGNFEAFGAFGASDLVKANVFYKQCADGGDAYCTYAYGKNLFYGEGVAKDQKRGLDLMLRAAEVGHTYAMNELGYIFISGKGKLVDAERGLRFYEAGAQHEDIYSFNNLGLVYLEGSVRPADPQKALRYFTQAASGGHPYAPTNLGRMARDGVGGPKDLAAATKWLELAAERGDYWGALDRARLADNVPLAARYLALAAALNRQGDNYDPAMQARKLLASLPAADKQRALDQLAATVEKGMLATSGALDQRLVETQRRAWQSRNPRFDLF